MSAAAAALHWYETHRADAMGTYYGLLVRCHRDPFTVTTSELAMAYQLADIWTREGTELPPVDLLHAAGPDRVIVIDDKSRIGVRDLDEWPTSYELTKLTTLRRNDR